ncbi:MAG: protein arginine kinase [Planctomycetota bacterium]
MSPFRTDAAAEWLRAGGPDGDVVVSSRVRLARNFAGLPFPNKAKRIERVQILELAERHILACGVASEMAWVDLNALTPLDCAVLVERHLISKQHSKGDLPRALAVSSPDERLAIMVNEEDHLRLQAMRSGLALTDAFCQVNDADDRLEAHTDFAYSPRFGYLTACPTNIGTGIRVSVMLHLPGLRLAGELEKVRRAAKAMNLAVRGFYGEGSEAVGDFFQISNQSTLGKSESQLLEDFEHNVIPRVIEYERLARKTLSERKRILLEDQVHRAVGTLTHARLLKTDEAMQALSLARLGIVTGTIDEIELGRVNQLILLTQPAHLQKVFGRDMDQATRRSERATLVRSYLSGEGDARLN